MQNFFEEGTRPTLEQVLARREERRREIDAAFLSPEKETSAEFPVTAILCLKLNIPGPVKSNEMIDRLFDRAIGAVDEAFEERRWNWLKRKILRAETGPEALYLLRLDPLELKRAMVDIEERHPLGRLFDLDVEHAEGMVSREQIGLAPRRCFLCGREARDCARSRRHQVVEMQEWITNKMIREGLRSGETK